MKRFLLLSAVLATALLWGIAGSSHGQESSIGATDSFKIVVHRTNPLDSMTRSQISSFLLKKKNRWPSGGGVDPVDLDGRSSVRASMSQAIHQRSVASIKNYWQRQIFAGYNTPPPELEDDAKVVDFVKENPGAIGYVSARVDLTDSEVKAVTITD